MIIFKICDTKFRNLGNNCNTDEIHDQTMRFGQLIEYNMRNIFLKKSFTKCGGETIPRRFSK